VKRSCKIPNGRIVAALAIGGLSLLHGACDDTFTVADSRPSLTWIKVIPDEGGATASLHFWIRDLEGDSVDVTARWERDGGDGGEIQQAPPSSPLSGRPTRDALLDPDGEEQRIVWDLAEVPEGAVRLVFTTDDDPRDGLLPDTWRSPDFDPRQGLVPAAPWVFVAD
jgi:hypothetical protein